MTDFTPEPDETLNETIARAAKDWIETDLATIVLGMRSVREKWNQFQAQGSRKRVQSKSVKPPKAKAVQMAMSLGKVKL